MRGCATLHERGVVHGDIRPHHVLLEMAGEEPDDLRILKLTDAGVPGVLSAGLSGGAAGQVAYLAPECLAGQARSPASDVYALGVLAYRLLTQLLPYRPEDVRAGAHDRDPVSRVRWLHLNASPVRPSRLVAPADFSPAVEAVIGRAMAKSLVDRYPDAGTLLVALETAMRMPLDRGPGAIAMPLSDELPTEGTLPDISPPPVPEPNIVPLPGSGAASAEGELEGIEPADSGVVAAVAPALIQPVPAVRVATAIPPTPVPEAPLSPAPRYWIYAVAGALLGCVLGLV